MTPLLIELNHSRNLAVRLCAGCSHGLFLLPALIAVLNLIPAGRVTAQTFTTRHSFSAIDSNGYNSDGAGPVAGLILSGKTLYGTASRGGSSGWGTVFAVNSDGTGFTNLHSFTAPANSGNGYYTNSDGFNAIAGLILSGNMLYGTASAGGLSGNGTVFALNTNGTGFTNLYSFTEAPYFTNSDGANPFAGLLLSGNTLYGTTTQCGGAGAGTVFALNTNGTGFTNLHSFSALVYVFFNYAINSEGARPEAGLILSGDTLYGTAGSGGSSGNGTVFALNTDGTGFTNLYSFTQTLPYPGPNTNSDGAQPAAGLVLSGDTLYGTAGSGGSSGNGTAFALNTDGTGFTNLHSFTAHPSNYPYTNSDGAYPHAGLILSGDTLYGTTSQGGSSGDGTVFAVNSDGTGFTTLHSFTTTSGPYPSTNSDGASLYAGLILLGNTLYGTTGYGGKYGGGTVFSISFPPRLTLFPSGSNLILMWPTNYAGFDYTLYILQSTTNLDSSAVWTTNSPAPVVVNGQNTVTNPISGTKQFFRLSQ